MSLAALESLASGKIDWDEIMQNFGKWLENGEFTPSGEAFDAGCTCVRVLINYFAHGTKATESGSTDEHSNGNGSLMRINPFVLYEYAKGRFDTNVIHTASALTHMNERSKMACGIYAFVLWELLKKPDKQSIDIGVNKARRFYKNSSEFYAFETMLFKRICGIGRNFSENFDEYRRPERDEIKSSGYVVDSLEAAIWCLKTSASYKECVLKAVNLGDDTDTIAAIVGGLAGALYGYDTIPQEWRNTLIKCEYIESLCKKVLSNWMVNCKE